VASTGFPQQRRLGLVLIALTLVMMPLGAAPGVQQRVPATPPPVPTLDPGPIFHVFLSDGRALASYGECAVVGDRVIFTLVIGDGDLKTQYQLMSLPASRVDVERTMKYRDAARAARYAATRGEADYQAITDEVSRALDELPKIENREARLAAAEEAKRKLLDWSRDSYHYRAQDIQTLAALFDDVIAQLRVAAGGEAGITMDLVAGKPDPAPEPVRHQPTLRESIEQALIAASVADVSSDRDAVLRTAADLSSGSAATADLATTLTRRIEDERALDQAYNTLRTGAIARAEAALARGDVVEAGAIRADAATGAQALGPGRSDQAQTLLHELDDMVERTRVHRAAVDRYTLMRPQLLAYERQLRPVLSALDSFTPTLKAIEAMTGPEFSKLERVIASIGRLGPRLDELVPPEDLADVHATFISALHLAREACARRRLAIATTDRTAGLEASAAAAGATVLVGQARENLVARLYPPKVR
jgi:hypothetical protein